jgi:Holliday junction DNA helicase RuvA
VLSGIEPNALVGAVRQNDLVRLTRIPGVGKKTAERMIIDLRDRLPDAEAVTGGAAPQSAGGVRDDILSALTNLGYQPHAVEKTVDLVIGRAGTSDFEPLLRDVLREMSR